MNKSETYKGSIDKAGEIVYKNLPYLINHYSLFKVLTSREKLPKDKVEQKELSTANELWAILYPKIKSQRDIKKIFIDISKRLNDFRSRDVYSWYFEQIINLLTPQEFNAIHHIISDECADKPTENDNLSFLKFVLPLATVIATTTHKNTPLSIGIYGEWGSGKTSFMKMLDRELRDSYQIEPIWFNAWKYDKEDNLWAALIQKILDESKIQGKLLQRLITKFKVWRLRISFRSGVFEILKALLLISIIVLLAIAAFTNWNAEDITTFIIHYIDVPQQLSANLTPTINISASIIAFLIIFFLGKQIDFIKLFESGLDIDFSRFQQKMSYRERIAFFDDVANDLKKIIKFVHGKKPLVVIIDDLDRCEPDKVSEVLGALKKVLDFEGCVFILGVDRNLTESIVWGKYKAILNLKDDVTELNTFNSDLIYNYLDKFIQLPISVPPIDEGDLLEFISRLFPFPNPGLCSSLLSKSFPRNPRKLKQILRVYDYLFTAVEQHVGIKEFTSFLLLRLIILQDQYRDLYKDISRNPSLLLELTNYYSKESNAKKEEFLGVADNKNNVKLMQYISKHERLGTLLYLEGEPKYDEKDVKNCIFFVKEIQEEPIEEQEEATEIEEKGVVPWDVTQLPPRGIIPSVGHLPVDSQINLLS